MPEDKMQVLKHVLDRFIADSWNYSRLSSDQWVIDGSVNLEPGEAETIMELFEGNS
jgi:hypothetical protein